MPLIAVPAPFPTLTPLSSDLQQSLVQHVKSVLINKTKAEQLRPTLGHKHSESTLTHRSSISPPPDSNVLKPGRQESCAHDDVPRLDSPFIDLTQPHQTSIMTVSAREPHKEHVTTESAKRCGVQLICDHRRTVSSISTSRTPQITSNSKKPAARSQKSLALALSSSYSPPSIEGSSPLNTRSAGTNPYALSLLLLNSCTD